MPLKDVLNVANGYLRKGTLCILCEVRALILIATWAYIYIWLNCQGQIIPNAHRLSYSELQRLYYHFQAHTSTIFHLTKSRLQTSASLNNIKLIPFAHQWDIKNVTHLCSENIISFPLIVSKQFYPYDNTKYEFKIKLYPKGESTEYKDYVSVFLQMESRPNSDASLVQFKFSILGPTGKKCNRKGEFRVKSTTILNLFYLYSILGGSHAFDSLEESWGVPQFILLKDLLNESNGYLHEGTLSILCEVLDFVECVHHLNILLV